MTAETMTSAIIAVAAVPLFYLIYFRHFFTYYREQENIPEYLKHVEFFLYGTSFALALVLGAPLLQTALHRDSLIFDAFVRAALIEKAGLLALFLAAARHYPRFSVLEGIVAGILLGCGFSLVENIVYVMNYGSAVIIPRLLFSAPLHLTTCGMMGYYLSVMLMSAGSITKAYRAFLALAVPVLFHGAFDYLMFNQNDSIHLSGPLVIVLVTILELFITRAKIIPAKKALALQGLRFEDWLMKYRQPRFERWIQNSMGTPWEKKVPLFKLSTGPALWVMVPLLLIWSLASLPFSSVITAALGLDLGKPVSVLLTTVYPASLAVTLAMVGVINPDFFRYNIVRLPILFDAVVQYQDREESIISFDIGPVNCFLRSFESLGTESLSMHFELPGFRSSAITARTLWENHNTGTDEPTGSIVLIENADRKFYLFVARYFLLRIWKGIIFNLKLPGFERIRKLFMPPATVLLKEVVYHPGTVIFKQGESINSFYFIKKGEVQIIQEMDSGPEIVLETMTRGQIFNEMALLGDTRRTVTARCLTRCVLAEARADNLQALIVNDPDFALALARKLLHRVDGTQQSLTQTIEYLQSLIRIKDRGIHRATLLTAMLFGARPEDGAVRIAAAAQSDKLQGVNSQDLAGYLRRILTMEKPRPEEAQKNQAVERLLDGLTVNIEKET
jgi:CRP-like cAMP-binding protein/RsiW-degrading membrane proteinase PrsW (M82 family)